MPDAPRQPYQRVLLSLALGCLLFAVSPVACGEELLTAAQVRNLTVDQAALQHPVRLRGVVTFFDEVLFSRFIQDSTAGIYLRDSTNTPPLTPGQIVEVEGVTGPGEFAPIVVPECVRVVGAGVLPAAKPVTFAQLASGREDSQFVEIAGIVRSARFEKEFQYFLVEIATGEGQLLAYVKQLPVERSEALVDCTVRVRGVCSTRFTRQRQLFAIRLMVPRVEDLQIEIPAAPDPFAIETRPIGSLLQFAPQEAFGHRVKVAGTVIAFDPGRVLYLQEGDQGLEVQTRQHTALSVGDHIEALGFASQGEYTPLLQDAIFRKISSGEAPAPSPVTHDEALKGTHDCRLIKIDAKLIGHAANGYESYLILQEGDFIFHAYLKGAYGHDPFYDYKNDSRLSVTGVCRIDPGEWQAGEKWRAKGFQIHLRSAADVVLLAPPPWWSLSRVLGIAGILALVSLVAFIWALLLRRRVDQQTTIIRQQLVVEADLKERYLDLFENANDMVFTHDQSGMITSLNKAGERLLQRGRESVVSRNLIELMPEDQQAAARKWLEQVVTGADMPATEWDFINAAGQRKTVEISSRLIDQVGRGAHVEVEGIGRDITERRRLERELLEISNREQRRIGHDLHDGVCQQLAGIAYLVDILGDKLSEAGAPEAIEAEKIGTLINEATAQARSVARGLFPVRLEENGLLSAIEEIATGITTRFKINCSFTSQRPPAKVDGEVALHLYYIVQEAAFNAVRHGKATVVKILLEAEGSRYKLTVQDNGGGFLLAGPKSTGMGVRIMRYRARVIGATLDLQSQPGHGTVVTCVFNPSASKERQS